MQISKIGGSESKEREEELQLLDVAGTPVATMIDPSPDSVVSASGVERIPKLQCLSLFAGTGSGVIIHSSSCRPVY